MYSQTASGWLFRNELVRIYEGSASSAYCFPVFFQEPSSPLKVGIPLAWEMPAPVKMQILFLPTRAAAALSGVAIFI
jgi:hypothetical protein